LEMCGSCECQNVEGVVDANEERQVGNAMPVVAPAPFTSSERG